MVYSKTRSYCRRQKKGHVHHVEKHQDDHLLPAAEHGAAGAGRDEGRGPHHERADPRGSPQLHGGAGMADGHPVREAEGNERKSRTRRQGGETNEYEATRRLHSCGPLRQGIQRQAGRGPVRRGTAAGIARLRREERIPRGSRVHRRGRERTHRRQAPVPKDAGRSRQTQRAIPRNLGLEILPLHTQARTRRRLQVYAS